MFGRKSQLWFHLPPIDTFRLRRYEAGNRIGARI